MKINNILKKIFIANILIVYLMGTVFLNFNSVFGYEVSVYKDGIESFPESYKEALTKLKEAHPNWNFVAVYTNLDFNYVVQQEMAEGKSLISMTAFSDEWKRDSVQVEPGWVNASEKAVRYFLDPRNFLTEGKIFQFESTKFNEEAQTVEVIESILNGSNLANANYYISAKNKVQMEEKFSDLILSAGKENNVSAAHLASRIVQETGGTLGAIREDGTVVLDANGNVGYYTTTGAIKTANRAINGSYSSDTYGDFSGYYNFFNIGAYCTSSCGYCGNPFVHGLQRAKSSGWTTPKIAISAAASYLNNNWIKYGQDTLYFEKFDVNFVQGAVFLFGNQYMTNISAASTESSLMYNGYKASNKLDSKFTFYIPVYDNMEVSEENVDKTEKKVQVINCEGAYLNLRSTPSTSGTIIAKLDNGAVMTQILDDGSGWIKVRLTDGTEGYVSKEYIQEVKETEEIPKVEVTEIKIDKDKYTVEKGNKITITPIVLPENATDKTYTVISDNENIVKVENSSLIGVEIGTANVTFKTTNGKEIKVSVEVIEKSIEELPSEEGNQPVEKPKYEININELTISEENYVTKINEGTKLSNITVNITLADGIKIISKDINGNELNNDSLIGTGTTVSILEGEEELAKYTVIVRGDSSGDGKITSSDYVIIKNNIMGAATLSDMKKLGADVNKDGKVSSSDYVLIKNHIMGISTITN